MKRVFSSFLALIFIWQIVGFVSYFEISHFKLKKEIKTLLKKGVPKEQLVVFEFYDFEIANLIWLKKNEFDLNGDLFDVVRSSELDSGKTRFECISDTQEKVLFASLNQNISSNLSDSHGNSPISSWFKCLNYPIVLETSETFQLNLETIVKKVENIFYYLETNYLINLKKDYPPPISI